MRRVRMDEEILKDRPVVTDVKPICALCGAELELEPESREFFCPVCDAEDQP